MPGTSSAVERLLGPVDPDPDDFVVSLNNLLLAWVTADENWEMVPPRKALWDYMEVVSELALRFPSDLTLDASPGGQRSFGQLASVLGYSSRYSRRHGFEVLPGSRTDDAARRAAAQALAIDVPRLAGELNETGAAIVGLRSNRVESVLPATLWQALTGESFGFDSLGLLASRQRLGLVLDGYRRLPGASREAMAPSDLQWAQRTRAVPFRRYASSFGVRGGRLVVPGGDAAVPVWAGVAGISVDSPAAFIRELLERNESRWAYLWHVLRHSPPEVAAHFLGLGSEGERNYPRDVFARLPARGASWDVVWSGELGFGTFARTIPLRGDPSELDLPKGGPSRWLEAIRRDVLPATEEALARAARRGPGRELTPPEFVYEVLTTRIDRSGRSIDPLPRLVRAVQYFLPRPHLATDANTLLFARVSDRMAPALAVLDALELREPETLQGYLLTLANLYPLGLDAAREQLVLGFQGGVEWLRLLAAAGEVEHGVLERRLAEWSRLHRGASDARAVAGQQLQWISRVLADLPAAAEGVPGRGPLERALLERLVPELEHGFAWRGLAYEGAPERRVAAAMARLLERNAIPSADVMAGVVSTLERLRAACQEGDLEAAHREARALDGLIERLSEPRTATRMKKVALVAVTNPDRARIAPITKRILKQRRPQGLSRLASQVDLIPSLLAADLRVFLVAPSYLTSAAAGGDVIEDPYLVRKHRLVSPAEKESQPWSPASVEAGDESLGSALVGYVGTAEGALTTFGVPRGVLSRAGGIGSRRLEAWQRSWVQTPWHRVRPETTALVHHVLAVGWEAIEREKKEATAAPDGGALWDSWLISRARLEEEARRPQRRRVSPAEAFALGLRAVEAAAGSRGSAAETGASLAAALDAVARLGEGWRAELALAGPVTPSLNGRMGRWMAHWPSYEAVEFELTADALVEREVVDLQLSVLDYLGRHGLPGELGSEILRLTLEDLGQTLVLQHERDWESLLQRVREMDESYFDARMRECIRNRSYRLRES